MTKFPDLHNYPYVVIDYETTGLKWWRDKIFGIAIATPDGKSGYWDIRQTPQALEWARNEFPRCQQVVAHNAKYECHFSREAGIVLPEGRVICTMVDAALLDEHMLAYNLDAVGKVCVGIGKEDSVWAELAALFGGKPTLNAQIQNLQRAPVPLAAKYARQDCTTTLKLYEWQAAEIAKQSKLDSEQSPDRSSLTTIVQLERKLLPVLVRMEQRGIRVDVNRAQQLLETSTTQIDDRYAKIHATCGSEFNINSPPQLREWFNPQKDDNGDWRTADGTRCEETDGGKPSLDSPTLRKMQDPMAMLIVELRALLKMRDTFLKGHIIESARDNGDHHTVHCNFNQAKTEHDLGTGTGRLSANDPALHQIHKRDKDKARLVRGLFLPHLRPESHHWLCFDWEQFEFRWFAHYVRDPKISAMYRDNPDTDFHGAVATMTGLPRNARFPGDPYAKAINLGLVFGMGQGRLAQEMGLPYSVQRSSSGKEWLEPGPEAIAVFQQYHGNIPGINDLLGSTSAIARSRGYVRTILGRHIRFPRGHSTHKAGGLIFQGTSADCMKQKLVEVDDYIRSGEVVDDELILMLSVHDEVDSSCTAGPRKQKYYNDLKHILETFDGVQCPIKCDIPIRADGGLGDNWWDACSGEGTQYNDVFNKG